jgi:hypothetical protein
MKYVVAEGDLATGFKLWGFFDTSAQAVREITRRQPLMRGGVVLEVRPMSRHPVKPRKDGLGVDVKCQGKRRTKT